MANSDPQTTILCMPQPGPERLDPWYLEQLRVAEATSDCWLAGYAWSAHRYARRAVVTASVSVDVALIGAAHLSDYYLERGRTEIPEGRLAQGLYQEVLR